MHSFPVGFDWTPRTRLIFGADTINRLGESARELGCRRALIVTDSGIVKAGHIQRAADSLRAAGIEWRVFDAVHENPTTADVDACLAAARDAEIDVVIGIGGGSSMDTAKGCNFLLTNGGRMQDYWGSDKATKPMLPMIAVPTTAGTGSECQSYALIADEDTHQKMACGDAKAAPRVAILDPTLTVSQPTGVTACTGLDAIAHAVETAVTRRRNELSTAFSREAFRLTISNFSRVLEEPDNLDARAAMLLGASFAGIAIENSMLGAAHSCANPLTARFGIVHGHAVGLMLPHVIRINAVGRETAGQYEELAHGAGLVDGHPPDRDASEILAETVELMLGASALPATLEECGVDRGSIDEMSAEAAGQWTAQFNPRPLSEADFVALYSSAFGR